MMRHDLRVIALLAAVAAGASPVWAQTPPSLGTAQSFAVLAGSAVTNTGSTTLSGDLGVSPGTAVTGFPPGVFITGMVHAGDAAAISAQTSVTTAYNSLSGQPCTQDLSGQDLGGLTLGPGVYCFSATAQLTGTLTLNAQGNAEAAFIFKIGSTLTTASGSSVTVINGASVCNVFWQVGSSATLGTATSFVGNILALSSITVTTGARLAGRALARTGAVTLDTNGISATCLVGIPPTCATIGLAPPTIAPGTVGVPYTQSLAGTGGTAPFSFALTSGTLPPGLSLTPAGVVTGTPTTATTSTFVVRATDAVGCAGSASYSIAIAPAGCPAITFTPGSPPNGTVGVAYSQTLAGAGGTGPYTFAITAGAAPAGLTLTPAGLLSGTPTSAATANFTITATDSAGCLTASPVTIVIAPALPPNCPVITFTPASPPNGTVGVAYSQTLAGAGGTGPYTFAITAGAIPAGLTLTPAGLLSGTPTTAATATFTITATDSAGCLSARAVTIVIAPVLPPGCPVITLTPASPPNGTVGVAYSQTFAGSGGTGPYTFALISGALPAGLTLTAAGALAGTPTASGTFTLTMRGTDANGCFADLPFTMAVTVAVPMLPQAFVVLLALGLTLMGYLRMRACAGRYS